MDCSSAVLGFNSSEVFGISSDLLRRLGLSGGISAHRNFGPSERRYDGTTVRRNDARDGGRFSAPHRASSIYIYILDARRGALKRPPSRASFRRTVVPSYRRSDVQKCRCAAIPMLRPKRRSKSEPEAEDFRRAEAQDLRATVQQLRTKPKATKPKGQDLTAKAQDHRAKEETELKPQS